ncbi:Protein cornichon 4 [Nymphon striatum]|nr:Protein cornichon 4 [Nymphon striatum]
MLFQVKQVGNTRGGTYLHNDTFPNTYMALVYVPDKYSYVCMANSMALLYTGRPLTSFPSEGVCPHPTSLNVVSERIYDKHEKEKKMNSNKKKNEKILTIPMGNIGMYDPTEIHNRGKLKKHLQESMIRLGYYLLFFFIYLYKYRYCTGDASTVDELNSTHVDSDTVTAQTCHYNIPKT